MTQFEWPSIQFLLFCSLWTMGISAIAFVGGSMFGLLIAIANVSAPKPVRMVILGAIQLVQATPLLVVILLSYYGLSFVGLRLPPLVAASVSLIVFSAVYLAEIWRGCMESIPRQQWEAADSLALSATQRLRYVIVPQALRISAPATAGFFVQIVKNSSLTSLIGFVELMRAGQLVASSTFDPLRVFLVVAAIYFVICFPISLLSQRLSRRLKRGTNV